MEELNILGANAKAASLDLALLSTPKKNEVLLKMADAVVAATSTILEANAKDLEKATENGIAEVMKDRLLLTAERIIDISDGLKSVAALPDPIGLVDKMWINEDGLQIGKQRVPLGVVGMIYESRPNVTTDAASLCFKTGNAVILRGGKEAIHSNTALANVMRDVLASENVPVDAIQLVQDTSRASNQAMFVLNDYLDVLIPRGGAGLIRAVKENATVPIIETGIGNCHIFVDKTADFDMARDIVVNAKTQRPSVCNAMETLVIHEGIASSFLPILEEALNPWNVELRADEQAIKYLESATPATESDWDTEFLDYILAIKTVNNVDDAIAHINAHNTGHSESIITHDYFNSQKFLQRIDAACVYVNASTRFTDGFVFGFGAEIGISTQKLHARGPMGLAELTSSKYIIYGDGQIRE
jgi:glutamate-5-semialdehyde dehydrogenase